MQDSKKTLTVLYIVVSILIFFGIVLAYYTLSSNENSLEKSIGIQVLPANDPIYNSLLQNFSLTMDDNFGVLKSTPPPIGDMASQYNNEFIAPPRSTRHNDTWIKYKTGHPPASVNYSALNFYDTTSTNTTFKQIDNVDAYVFDNFISQLKSKFDSLKHTKDYNLYSDLAWSYFFKIKRPEYLNIGKVFIATKSTFAVYPYHEHGFKFNPSERFWWQAANYKDSIGRKDTYSDLKFNNVGLTKLYTDIESQYGNTDLNRTIWYKKYVYGRTYIIGADIRLVKLPDIISQAYVWPISFGVLLSIIFLLLLIYNTKTTPLDNSIFPVYRMQRIGERIKVSFNNASEISISQGFNVKNTFENKTSTAIGWNISVSNKVATGIFSKRRETSNTTQNEELKQLKISKNYDLSFNNPMQNLKAVEIWSVHRLDDNRYTRAVIEVLWLNESTQNIMSLANIYWDQDFSAPGDLIHSTLRKHLLSSESTIFLSDTSPVIEPNKDLFLSLTNLPFVKDMSVIFDSFKNRLLLFENNIPILQQIYTNSEIEIEATSSLDFMRNLINNEKLEDIFRLKVKKRYIIEGPNEETFKNFAAELTDAQKIFLRREIKENFVIEYRQTRELIYYHRDFCIFKFANGTKCVFYTDMRDRTAQKGWISWRQVDIDFYGEILNYLNSSPIEKRPLNNFL